MGMDDESDRIPQCLPPSVTFLAWDSAHFGFPIGRLELPAESRDDVANALTTCQQAGLQLVYWFVDAQLSDALLIERFGGRLVDHRATFRKEVAGSPLPEERLHHPSTVCSLPLQAPPQELLDLAVLAGQQSRFCNDPEIPRERFESLYHQWVVRSALRELADDVFVVATSAEPLAGFVTVKQRGETGIVGLIAVAKSAQGRGLGQVLLHQVDDWIRTRHLTHAEVVTQADNRPACRLYERCGYRLERTDAVYHFWLNKGTQHA